MIIFIWCIIFFVFITCKNGCALQMCDAMLSTKRAFSSLFKTSLKKIPHWVKLSSSEELYLWTSPVTYVHKWRKASYTRKNEGMSCNLHRKQIRSTHLK